MDEGVQVVYPRCAGLDIHSKTVVACRITLDGKGKVRREVRTFRTMTGDLVALSHWLSDGEVTHVAMESTGVYWQPVFNLLENSFHLLLVNAQHIKAVPGRKTRFKTGQFGMTVEGAGLCRPGRYGSGIDAENQPTRRYPWARWMIARSPNG